MASSLSAIVAKDGTPNTIAGGILAVDKSGTGAGPFVSAHVIADSQGVNIATVKAASTAAQATDPAFVIASAAEGTQADSTYVGTGSASIVSILKGLFSSVNGSIPAGTSTIGNVNVLNPVSTASRVNAAASTNATNLKASAGNLYAVRVFNVAAYNVFLKIYNKASSPTVGTDIPVWTIPVPAGGGYSDSFDSSSFPLGTGISYAITKLQADTDTTAVAAGDLTGTIQWV